MTGRETAVRLVGVLAAAGALAGGVGGALAAGSLTGDGGPEPTASAREARASADAGLRASAPATQALRTPVLTPAAKAERKKKPRAHRRARPKRAKKAAARRRAVPAYQPAPAVTASLPDNDTAASGTSRPAPARGGTIVAGTVAPRRTSPAASSRPSPEPAAKAPVKPKPEPAAAKKPAPQPDPAGPTGTFDDSG